MSSCPTKPCKPYTSKDKWIVSILAGILFLLISCPMAFRLSNSVIYYITGISLLTKDGCPNMIGIILHTIIFILIVRLLMR